MKTQEFDYSVDLIQALLWQYNEATRLQLLLTQKNFWYSINHQIFWMDWYTNVFDLRTANLFGLAVWSYILSIPLFVESTPDPFGKPVWGMNTFVEATAFNVGWGYNFENGNFTTARSSISLSTEEQRLVLRLRYYQLVSRGATGSNQTSVAGTNEFLSILFADYPKIDPDFGVMYVLDGLDMTITYVFNFSLSESLRDVLTHYDVLPRPAGVEVKYVVST
jgi:uncharacterized protein DUF2612